MMIQWLRNIHVLYNHAIIVLGIVVNDSVKFFFSFDFYSHQLKLKLN